MSDNKDTTKIEVCGRCVRIVEPDPASKYPKLEVWIEEQDGQYTNTLAFEGGSGGQRAPQPPPAQPNGDPLPADDGSSDMPS